MLISDWSSDVCSSDLLFDLRGDLNPGQIKDAEDEREHAEHDDQQPPAARDRQRLAEQPHPAVEHRGEHEPTEDDEQRLDQQHDKRDRANQPQPHPGLLRSEETTSELQSLMRTSYASI